MQFRRANIQDLKPDEVPAWMEELHKGEQFPFHGMICQPLPFLSGLTGEVICREKPDFSKEFLSVL